MAVITLPALVFGAECGWGQQRHDLVATSEATGAEQVRLLSPPRWTLKLVQPATMSLDDAAAWQALVVSLRGRVNVLAAWDPIFKAPRGTMRGSLTLATAAAAGAATLSVSGGAGQAGKTLAAGDRLQLGVGLGSSQVVMVMSAATANASGVVQVTVEPPLRAAYASATAVAWDRPMAYFRSRSQSTAWTYAKRGTRVTGMSLDLVEVFG